MTKKVSILLWIAALWHMSGICSLGGVLNTSPLQKSSQTEQGSAIAKQIENLKNTTKKYSDQAPEQALLQKIGHDLQVLTTARATGDKTVHEEFIQKKRDVLSRFYQVVTEIIQLKTQIASVLQEHIAVLEQYRLNPNSEDTGTQQKASASFQDIQKATKLIAGLRDKIEEFTRIKETIKLEQEKRKTALDAATKEAEEKKKQQDNFHTTEQAPEDLKKFSKQQQGEIIDEQLHLLQNQQILAQLKYDEGHERFAFLETKISLNSRRLALVEEHYKTIKHVVVIDKATIQQEEEALEKSRHEFSLKREKFEERIRALLPVVEEMRHNFQIAITQIATSPNTITAIKNWVVDPELIKSASEWESLCTLGLKHAQLTTVEANVSLAEAHILEAKLLLRQQEHYVEILRTWDKITKPPFYTAAQDAMQQETNKYDNDRSQLLVTTGELTEKRDGSIELLYNLNLARDTIKKLLVAVKKQKSTLFAQDESKYTAVLSSLMAADDELRKRIDVTTKLMETYAKGLGIVREDAKGLETILNELTTKAFWTRSKHSIEWREVKNFLPDIQRFFDDLGISILTSMTPESVILTLGNGIKYPYEHPLLFLFILMVIIWVALAFVVIHWYAPAANLELARPTEWNAASTSRWRLFASLVITFCNDHLLGLYAWSILFLASHFLWPHSLGAVLFYLLSIPYLGYLSYSLMTRLLQVNTDHGLIFFDRYYQSRFDPFLPILAPLSVGALCFRHAFILGNYYHSQVPEISLAFLVIVLQIALVWLIMSKEVIIGRTHVFWFFSRSTPFGKWLEERIDQYFYVFFACFAAIIIMINPYVGYGKQVVYILFRVLVTALLIPVIIWLYERIKRASSELFFYYPDGSLIKERFTGGRTWYGLVVISSFFFVVMLGLFVISNIWDKGVSFHHFSSALHYPLYNTGEIDEVTRQQVQVTLFSIFKIFFYILGGMSLVFVINRFIVSRIFDPLIVGSGVQNTITTLTRYIIILIAFFMGLNNAGLGSMATKFAIIITVLGYIAKDPLSDFFAYFIILVQRPIKIGDYIVVDSPSTARLSGVVRHITPRYTVVRQRNSTTCLVPNSLLITKVVRNWHYSRTFIAFEDILVPVPQTASADLVRKLLLQVLDEHTYILKNPTPIVRLVDFTNNGYQFMVRGFLSSDKVMDKWEIESQVRLAIVRRLSEAGISLTSPTHVILQSESRTDLPDDPIRE